MIWAEDSLLHLQDTLVAGSEAFYGSPHLLVSVHDGLLHQDGMAAGWILVVILIAGLCIGLSRYFFAERVAQFFKASFAVHYFNQMEREGGLFNETVTYLMFLNYLLVFSLMLWVTMQLFGWVPAEDLIPPPVLYLLLLLGATLFFLLKSLFLGFLSWVFNTRKATQGYLKNLFLFNQLKGLVLLPVVSVLVYHPTKTGLLTAWMLFAVAGLIKVARGALLGHRISGLSGYYLILYLCSIELAPLLVMLKAADKYILQG
jgi:hypothetical protein